jgi:iron complex outermembrane receptor protein
MLKKTTLVRSLSLAFGTAAFAAMSPAMAQTAEPAVQKVVVTGSMISRADRETPTPVQVLTAADIAKSGKTSVAELLTDLAANGAGTLGTGFAGAFANGATGISLRGLTVGATLVLVDGHRMAPYPLSDDAQRSFVDVSSIPFDAIDHIDVLKSGASSLYGSDAIAGVINIVLKKNMNGTRVSSEIGNTEHGGGKTKRASIGTGFGDLATDGYNVFATAEWRKQGAIKVSDRDTNDWDNRDWRARGGNDLTLGRPTSLNGNLTAPSSPFLYNPAGVNPAGVTNVNNPANYQFLDPSCNFTKYRAGGCSIRDMASNIQPATENINGVFGFTKQLGADWELSLKGSIFQRENQANRGIPLAYSPTTFAGFTSLNNGVLVSSIGRIASTLIPATTAINKLGAPARLYGIVADIDPTISRDNHSTSTRYSADLKGTAMGWDLSLAVGATKVKTDIDYSGYLNRTALYTAINNNTWNPLGNNSPAVVAAVSPRFSNSLESTLNYFDGVASRELMDLGAGPLAAAVGVHYHKRDQNAPPSAPSAAGITGNTDAFVIGSETNSAIFGELRATPIKDVEVSLASRYDHYDTYGNSFTPSASVKWTPMKQLGFRANVAKGFRAPNPSEVGNAGSFFTFNAINDPILCVGGKNTNAGSVVNGACGLNPPYVQVTDAPLAPEKSTSYTFGMIIEPFKGLNATLDYYNIEVKNQIVTAAGNDPSFVPAFVRGPATPVDISNGDGTSHVGTPSVGPIIYAKSPYLNLGSTKTSGIEADVSYKWNMAEMGTLKVNVSAAHEFSYETIAGPGSDPVQLAGTQGPSVVGGATGNPKDRAQFTLDWNRGPLNITATTNFVGSFSGLDPSVGGTSCDSTALDVGGRTYFQNLVQPEGYCTIHSFTTTNLNVQYKVSSNLTLRGSILNVFDRQPPYDVSTYGNGAAQTSYNASLHQAGAVGRFFSLGLNYTF